MQVLSQITSKYLYERFHRYRVYKPINRFVFISNFNDCDISILLSFSKEIGQRIAKAKIYCPKRAVRLRKLKSHPFFQDLVTWREVTIKNMNYDCELRRKLFTDMLDIKLKCLYNEILETISKSDYFDSSLEDFRATWVSFQPRVRLSGDNPVKRKVYLVIYLEEWTIYMKKKLM